MSENNLELLLHFQDNEWPFEFTDHDRLIARAIVFDEAGYFYFNRMVRDDVFGKGAFIETAGGGVEDSEDLHTAVKREAWEELAQMWKLCVKLVWLRIIIILFIGTILTITFCAKRFLLAIKI